MEEIKLYNIAICDDNNIFLKLLSETIKSEFSNHEVDVKIFTFNDGRSLINAVESREQYFNFIFLDINMPEIDGFSTAKRLVEIDKEFLLLFITNLDSCATEGYKYNAFRYIIKSRFKDDLKEAIDNIVLKMNYDNIGDECIAFSESSGNVIEIKKKDIIFLEIINKRVRMITTFGKYDLLTYRLKKYFEELGKGSFAIIMRSYIVNMDFVESFENDYFHLTGGWKISMGHTKKSIKESKEKYIVYCRDRF